MTKQEPVVGDLRTVTQRFNGKEWVLCLQSMPPKELSDEEIIEIADNPWLCNEDGSLRSCIDFAKAILKKASEK